MAAILPCDPPAPKKIRMSLLDYFSKPNRLVRPEESTSSNHTAATQPSASQDNNENSQHEGHTVSTYIFFELIKIFFYIYNFL